MPLSAHLFVYGTLLRGLPSPPGRYLRRHSKLLGNAYVNGRLYDLGTYPGLWYDAGSTKRIFGQLLLLDEPEEALPLLDEYEGIDPRHPSHNEYRREEALANWNGHPIPCWCYLLNQMPARKKEILCGNYLEYLGEG